MRPWREKGWWLLAATIVVFFREPLTTQTFFFRDLYLLFYPKKVFLAEALRRGEIPMWDPLMHGGQPYLASPNNTFFAPSNLLYLALSPLTAFNVIFVLQFIACGWAAYALARCLRLSPVAAFVCGAMYALCGYSLSTANLMPLVLALPWVPATLAFAHLLATQWRGRWLVGGSICAALPLLSGAAELTAMMFTLVAAWLLLGLHEAVPLRRRVLTLAALLFFSVMLSLVQTVPAVEMIRQSARGAKQGYENFSQWSVHPRRIPELVIPGFFGPTAALEESDYWGIRFEGQLPYILSIYIGGAGLLLAIAGATTSVLAWRARLSLSLLALTGVILSLGSTLPFFRLIYEHVPLVGIFRYPVKAMMLSLVPLAVLAGAGTDALRERPSRATLASAIALSIILLTAFTMRESFDRTYFAIDLKPDLQSELSRGLLHAAGFTTLFALILLWQWRRGRDIRLAVAVLVLADLALVGSRVNAYAPRDLFAEMPLAGAVRQMVGDGRFYRAPEAEYVMSAPSNDVAWLAWDDRRLLRRYEAAMAGIPMIFHADYDGLAPVRVVRLTSLVDRLPWPHRLNVLERAGVTAFLAPDRVTGMQLDAATVDTGTRATLYLYRNRNAAPFRFASEVVSVSDEREALRAVVTHPFEPESVILISSDRGQASAPVQPCGTARGRLLKRSLNSLTVAVDAPCDGYLVMNETFYPGWRATVDGRAAELVRADFIFSAVPVGRGRHVVQRTYRSPFATAGLIGTGLGAAVMLSLAYAIRRQRRRVEI